MWGVGAPVCASMWSSEADMRSFFWITVYLTYCVRVSQLNPRLAFQDNYLDSLLGEGPLSCPSFAGIVGRLPHPLGIYVGEKDLQSCSHTGKGQHFTHQVPALARNGILKAGGWEPSIHSYREALLH